MIFLEINPNAKTENYAYEPVENRLNVPELYNIVHGVYGSYELFPNYELTVNKVKHMTVFKFNTVLNIRNEYLLQFKYSILVTGSNLNTKNIIGLVKDMDNRAKLAIKKAKSIRTFGFKRNGERIKGLDLSFNKRRILSQDPIEKILEEYAADFDKGFEQSYHLSMENLEAIDKAMKKMMKEKKDI